MQSSETRIKISVTSQQLSLSEEGEETLRFPISTSKFGLGTEEGSYKTPLGQFEISDCYGGGLPCQTIFKGRRPIGQWAGETVDADLVLTRILWLEGKEDVNANTKSRYIYIHGTNQEDHIGTPASYGCIRMRNEDMIALYERVRLFTHVEIVE